MEKARKAEATASPKSHLKSKKRLAIDAMPPNATHDDPVGGKVVKLGY